MRRTHCALAALSLCLPLASRAQAAPTFSDRLCVSLPQMQAIYHAFELNSAKLRKMADQDVAIDVRAGSVKATAPPASCAIFPAEQTIEGVGSIAAAYVASFGVVTAYRHEHPWPLGPVSADPSRVDVVASRYGKYAIVSLADNHRHRDAAGNALLGCDGVEYYRVDFRRGVAWPFDGCVESHHRGVLPALSQLPP